MTKIQRIAFVPRFVTGCTWTNITAHECGHNKYDEFPLGGHSSVSIFLLPRQAEMSAVELLLLLWLWKFTVEKRQEK